MSNPRKKAKELLHKYRMLLMNDGEDYGEEILVSVLSKQCALIAVKEIIQALVEMSADFNENASDSAEYNYWEEVKKEIVV